MKSQNIIMLAMVMLAVSMGAGAFVLFNNQKELHFAVGHMAQQIQENAVKPAEVNVIEKIVAQQPWAPIQDKAKDTVVQIMAQTVVYNLLCPYQTPQQSGGLGSGFFINEREIITNNHVIEDAKTVWIRIPSLGKALIDVEVVGKTPERDLALLRLTDASYAEVKSILGEIPYLRLGDSDQVHRADELLTLGYPLGQTGLKSTTGVVSGREHLGGRQLIQISSAINQGSSGGPSLSLNGQVVGITVSGILSAQNIGYIIPINELKIILEDLRKKPLLRKPFLGVLLTNGSKELASYLKNPVGNGAYVVDVFKGSPLAKIGVEAGDVLYEINGHAIDYFGELNVPWSEDKLSVVDYASMLKLGQQMNVVIYRNGTKKQFNFTFEDPELPPIRRIFPSDEGVEYEIFGGLLIQPLTLNHIPLLINNATSLAKYTEFEEQLEPKLIVTHIVPTSQVHKANILREGAIIKEVNGNKVKTLDELRDAITKLRKNKESYVMIKTTEGAPCTIDMKKSLDDEERLSNMYGYPISEFIQTLLSTEDVCGREKGATG